MAGSMKDALEKSGVAPPADETPKPKLEKKLWKEALPDDEKLPPLFEAPALTKPTGSSPQTAKKAPPRDDD